MQTKGIRRQWISGDRIMFLLAIVLAAESGPHSAFSYQEQNNGVAPTAAVSGDDVDWEARGLSSKIVEVPSVGLELHLPLESSYSLKPQSERRLEVVAPDSSWIAAVDVRLTANDENTVGDVANATIQENQEKSVFASVPKRSSLVIHGQPAERLVIDFRPQQGQENVHAMYTIFKPLPKTFVIYRVWTKASNADEVFTLHKAVVDSFQFSDPKQLAERRQAEVDRTQKALDALNRSKIEELIVPVQWYRIYSEGEDAQKKELAYYRVTESIGMLGQVGGAKDPQTFDEAEREQGLLVELMSRYLVEPDGSQFVDIESTAWMSFDRSRERWVIRSARYMFEPARSRHVLVDRSSMTGDRRGDVIQVMLDFPPSPTDTIQLMKPKDAYVSQAEQHVLYRILKPWEKATYGMYLFEPQVQRLVYRTEKLEPGQPTRSESMRMKDTEPNKVTLNQDGTIARIVMANGNITVPTTLEDLIALWKAQGLPTGRGDATEQVSVPTDRKPGAGGSQPTNQGRRRR